MLKRLFLIFLFSGSLSAFSQVKIDTVYFGRTGLIFRNDTLINQFVTPATPDTLRAICLVTMCRKCAAEPRMGFVVIAEGKEVEYLDCRKKALKLPQVGWGYKLIDPNYKQK